MHTLSVDALLPVTGVSYHIVSCAMTDTEPVAPAAKLRKVIEGDVTVASVNQDITPEAKATMTTAKQVAAGIGEQPTAPPAAASQMDGGKKRKVALYVAYIGAGYHVSAPGLSALLKLVAPVYLSVTPCPAFRRCF